MELYHQTPSDENKVVAFIFLQTLIAYYSTYKYVEYFRNSVARRIQARNEHRTRRLDAAAIPPQRQE